MGTVTYNGKIYVLDGKNYLSDFFHWDENFAEWMAQELKTPDPLTKEHWDVLHSIRSCFSEHGKCPTVYETCRLNGLGLDGLMKLFPHGYLRGACRMAGITYREGYFDQNYLPSTPEDHDVIATDKIYNVDVRGFLIDPDDWDKNYAAHRAYDMKIHGGRLNEGHWKIIHFLRDSFAKNNSIPTVYEACASNEIDIDELEKLFPDGYHRGAVKIAGLRIR